ncbi:acetylornithine deacetylase/succinyl-diaminopimelate desuccinylase [Actinomadura pelletieri DSM 43383]|uniref:Acetylornithine deacetylase/succinyl-diaminopimelate desuccinylase n=1 Tax=Actinomadura pelletieri DSM 43383 TaxID=1120940 RepID=A0A495QXY7_9ACTN|nr:M20/M25/M40 family metallo-hydrolase [Actinomadura pelletieri]RKS78982.1 acetylornithine deacetylase/succinyl-diaminopimelate desuccinylase [Actinomadura pelletieri DSM 43383]
MATVATHDHAARVLDLIDRNETELVTFLQDFLRIPSVWGDGPSLTAAAEHLAAPLADAGLAVELPGSGTDGMPNVLARADAGDPDKALIFNGHMEVYPPSQSWVRDPFGGDIDDGRIYGVGVADMKAGTAAMTMAAAMLARSGVPLPRDVVVLAVPNHFEGGEGTRQALRDGLRGAYAINCEPSDLKVLTGQRGIAYVTVTVRGRAAHTTALDIGVNAVARAADIVREVLAMPITGPDGEPLDDVKICNVAQISGGVAHNLVPERCEITFDFRFPATQTQDDVLRDVRAAVERAVDRLGEFPVDVGLEATCLKNPRSSLRVPSGERLLADVAAAHHHSTGEDAAHDVHPAWPDTPIFWESGIKAVTYGPGSMDCYWDDEWVAVADYLTAVRTYAVAALTLGGSDA